MLRGHGDDIFDFPDGINYNFSSNVWYGGPPSGLVEELRKTGEIVDRYPEPEAVPLKRDLAEYYGIGEDCLQITSGATEAIHLIGRIFRKSRSLILTPSFSEYEDACRISEMEILYHAWPGYTPGDVEWSSLIDGWIRNLESKLESVDPDLVFICNPNNPGGEYILDQNIRSLVNKFPRTYFIIDEAYLDFVYNSRSVIHSTGGMPNLVVIKSMTKAFGIPGIRVGYFIAHPDLVKRIRAVQYPWSVSTPAILAGRWIVRNKLKPEYDLPGVLREGIDLSRGIDAVDGFTVRQSTTHFFLVRMDEPRSPSLKRFLAEKHKILIRDASNFRGLDNHWFRVCAREKSENEKLIEALRNWKNTGAL